MFRIRQAATDDAPILAPLFDAYRVFYGKPSDVPASMRFLAERMARKESIILLAESPDLPGESMAFAQLYPSYSSVQLARTYILNDLYVGEPFRRRGIASALLRSVADLARTHHACFVALLTEKSNAAARALYEREGWEPDEHYQRYTIRFTPSNGNGHNSHTKPHG